MIDKTLDWHGSFAVIVTPFTRDGEIDEEGYRGVINSVLDAGCHGVISAGSTGEFFLMTNEERKRVFSIAVDEVCGRVPVLAGTSATRTEDVIDLTKYAAGIGFDGAMILPPIYIGIDEREVVEFYSRIAGEAGLPIMLYNSPLAVMTGLPAHLVDRLAEIDQIVAIKDSSLDMNQVANLIQFCGDRIGVFIGAEDLMLSAVAMGAVGAVAMVPQIVGKMAVDLYSTAAAGDIEEARQLHQKIVRVYDLFKIGSGYVVIKESMNMLGKPGGYSRPPMLPLTSDQRLEIRTVLEDVGLKIQ